MAPRAFWKGHLKVSLVTCPVALSPATTAAEKMRFHTLNARTGNRVRSRYVDVATGEPVEGEDEARAFQLDDGRQVIVEDEDLEAIRLETTRTIDIETFVGADDIGWIWLDTPHHLVPDGRAGEEAFSVIREAMKATSTVGIARLVLYRRERAVMVAPCGRGLMLWTLRYGDEVRDPGDVFEGIVEAEVDPEALGMLDRLIDARTKPWSPAMVKDPVQARLRELVEAKAAERTPRRPKRAADAPEAGGNVVSILDALRRSIETERKPGKRGGKRS